MKPKHVPGTTIMLHTPPTTTSAWLSSQWQPTSPASGSSISHSPSSPASLGSRGSYQSAGQISPGQIGYPWQLQGHQGQLPMDHGNPGYFSPGQVLPLQESPLEQEITKDKFYQDSNTSISELQKPKVTFTLTDSSSSRSTESGFSEQLGKGHESYAAVCSKCHHQLDSTSEQSAVKESSSRGFGRPRQVNKKEDSGIMSDSRTRSGSDTSDGSSKGRDYRNARGQGRSPRGRGYGNRGRGSRYSREFQERDNYHRKQQDFVGGNKFDERHREFQSHWHHHKNLHDPDLQGTKGKQFSSEPVFQNLKVDKNVQRVFSTPDKGHANQESAMVETPSNCDNLQSSFNKHPHSQPSLVSDSESSKQGHQQNTSLIELEQLQISDHKVVEQAEHSSSNSGEWVEVENKHSRKKLSQSDHPGDHYDDRQSGYYQSQQGNRHWEQRPSYRGPNRGRYGSHYTERGSYRERAYNRDWGYSHSGRNRDRAYSQSDWNRDNASSSRGHFQGQGNKQFAGRGFNREKNYSYGNRGTNRNQ